MTFVVTDPDVRAALSRAGWSERRQIDVTAWVGQLRGEGFSVTDPAVDLLRSVGGLTVEPVTLASSSFRPGLTVFDPLFAATGEASRVRQWEDELGTRLTPVGEWSDEAVLLVDQAGVLYADAAWRVDRLGSNLQDGLRVAITGDGPRTVLIDTQDRH